MGETSAAERGRLARARDTVETRRKATLMAVIAESRRPPVEPFDWAAWRAIAPTVLPPPPPED